MTKECNKNMDGCLLGKVAKIGVYQKQMFSLQNRHHFDLHGDGSGVKVPLAKVSP